MAYHCNSSRAICNESSAGAAHKLMVCIDYVPDFLLGTRDHTSRYSNSNILKEALVVINTLANLIRNIVRGSSRT